jgi:hypothetical protein
MEPYGRLFLGTFYKTNMSRELKKSSKDDKYKSLKYYK